MYTLIVCLVLAIIAATTISKKFASQEKIHRADCFVIHAIALIVGLVICAFATVIFNTQIPLHTVAITHRIATMRSSQELHGAFVIGSGSINTQEVYHFYELNDDGSLTPKVIVADASLKIVEDPTLSSIGYWTDFTSEAVATSPYVHWGIKPQPRVLSRELRVPVGTVIREFSLQ
jgi:hypothetical protein